MELVKETHSRRSIERNGKATLVHIEPALVQRIEQPIADLARAVEVVCHAHTRLRGPLAGLVLKTESPRPAFAAAPPARTARWSRPED